MPVANETLRVRCPEAFVATLDGTFGPARWSRNAAHWKTPAGPLRATISDIDAIAIGGRRVHGAIDVVQQIRLGSPKEAKAMAARHNTQPGLGLASVVPGIPSVIEVASRACLFADEAKDGDRLGLNLAIAAICHMATSMEYGAGKPVKRLPQHDEPCRWDRREFFTMMWIMDRAGDVVSFDGCTLIAQLKSLGDWLPGVTARADARLALSGEHFHSVLGAGLAVEVSVCIGLGRVAANRFASRLNELELKRVMGPPLFGAWAIDLTAQRLLFSSFWPNVGYVPNLLPRIATWSVERLELVNNELWQIVGQCKALL